MVAKDIGLNKIVRGIEPVDGKWIENARKPSRPHPAVYLKGKFFGRIVIIIPLSTISR